MNTEADMSLAIIESAPLVGGADCGRDIDSEVSNRNLSQ